MREHPFHEDFFDVRVALQNLHHLGDEV